MRISVDATIEHDTHEKSVHKFPLKMRRNKRIRALHNWSNPSFEYIRKNHSYENSTQILSRPRLQDINDTPDKF